MSATALATRESSYVIATNLLGQVRRDANLGTTNTAALPAGTITGSTNAGYTMTMTGAADAHTAGLSGVAVLAGIYGAGTTLITLAAATQMISTGYAQAFRAISRAELDWLEFQLHIDAWRRERGATSSITRMAMCPAYQQIIAMGPRSIPLIFRQMENEGDEPDMWFWALRVLTGSDPVSDADRGDIVRMAQAWLAWGRRRYAW
jgi:hypothetical protein